MSAIRYSLIAAALGFLMGACGGGSGGNQPNLTPLAREGFDVSPPRHEEPVLLVPWDYVPPEFPLIPGDHVNPPECSRPPETVYEYCQDVTVAGQQRPQFDGVISRIRLDSWRTAREDTPVESCEIRDFPLVDELSFEYLPPGTYATGPQFAAVCEDGSRSLVMQDLGDFMVIFFSGERVLEYEASVDRLTTGVVQGKQAVVIVPYWGRNERSWVAFATRNGFISVESRHLRLTETLKVAEGVRCASC